SDFSSQFTEIAKQFEMQWRVALSDVRPRVAILVSKYDHCLVDLLYRHQSGELVCDIACVISNHSESQSVAEFYRVPFYLVPVTKALDAGPIIEQDVVRVSHRDSVDDIVQKGRDLEKVVLSRAVRWHIENRVLLYGNKTVVFE